MGAGDYMPTGHHRRRYDPKAAKRIREGGKKADAIRQLSVKQHQEHEVPAAEEELQKALEAMENNNNKQK
ncbi:hypothetical protein JXA05_03470 [Candidatus Peregrinibacteria bacterium]|nr:hypothetical protein [Candidatus Peregrinibacteria bacterium]